MPMKPSATSTSNERLSMADTVDKPWGSSRVLGTGPFYLVKEITVAPNQRLSLQYHDHRAEHWVCVAGSGYAEIAGRITMLSSGIAVEIPLRWAHRLVNNGVSDLVIVETQLGAILSEEDIVRIHDDYGR
jgi:mannose-6-phosphate isomerase